MRQSSLSRTDLAHITLVFTMQVALGLFATVILHPIAGLIAFLFIGGLIPFVNDMVSKDRKSPPYERCEGCGNLYSKTEMHDWREHKMCYRCNKDTESQKEFATNFPMWVKRLRKN